MTLLNEKKRGFLLLVTVLFVFMLGFDACSKGPSTLSGRISDAYSGVPLPGVTVQVKDTDSKVLTAEDGTYSLTVPAGAGTLVVSLDGYKTLEIEIKGRTEIYAVLSQSSATNPLWNG